MRGCMTEPPIFRPSFGNKPDNLVGRESALSTLTQCFDSYPGMRERAVLITGQRGMGKTAMLLEASDLASSKGFVAVRTTCGAALLDNILDGLQHAGNQLVTQRKPPIKGFSAGALGFSFGLTFTDEARQSYGFKTKLGMICERLEEKDLGVAILVDEVRPNSEAMRQLATAYQELTGDGRNLALIMAGLPSVVSALLEEETLTFLNRATKVRLSSISESSVRQYYSSAFSRSKRSIAIKTLRDAAAATEGFPYMLQLIGYYLVSLTSEGEQITSETLDEALVLARADLDENVFLPMVRPLSQTDMAFLEAMAHDNSTSRVADIQKRLGMSQGSVQSYRKRLIEAGVVTSPRRGELCFVVPMLADYLRQREASRA